MYRQNRLITTYQKGAIADERISIRQIPYLLRLKEDEKQKKQAAAKAKRKAHHAEKKRQARMIEMQSAPDIWFKKASTLVEQRGTDNYREAASILADLRDAFGGEKGNKIARKHAAHLVQKYPTLSILKSSLRKKELLE